MSLGLMTKSHGIIDSGFYKAFMKLSLVGKYAFETKDLCDLAQSLAENPRFKEAIIFGYDADKFWQLEKEYNSVFGLKRISSLIEKNSDEITSFVRENRQLSAEEKIELMTNKIEVPVRVYRFKKSVKIGEYEIGNSQFVQMMYYIFNGGFNGWAGPQPDFVKSAFTAIKASRSSLYKSKCY